MAPGSRLLLSVLCVALGASACSGGGGDDGAEQREARSAAYVASVAQWQQSQLAPAVAAAKAVRFSDLIVVGRVENARERAVQQTRCRQVASARDGVAALTPPALEGDGTKDATSLRDEITSGTSAYTAEVSPLLGQVAAYCATYAKGLALADREQAAERALAATRTKTGVLDRYSVRRGLRITFYSTTCDDPRGCIPGGARRTAYLKAYKVARIDLVAQRYALNGASGACPLAALQPVCDLYKADRSRALSVAARVYDVVKAAPDDIPDAELDPVNNAFTAHGEQFAARFKATYAKAFPGADTSAKSYPTKVDIVLLRQIEAHLRSEPGPTGPLPTASSSASSSPTAG